MNLIDEAESLMLHQFKNSPKLIGLIRGLVTPLDGCDRQVQALHHGRYIEEAEGERLDILGRIVGQPRRDMDDEEYRSWILVAIRLNISSGTAEDVLGILNILYGKTLKVLIQERPPNVIEFSFFSLPSATQRKILFAILRSACPVGSKCAFVRVDVGAAATHNIKLAGLKMHKANQIFRFDKTPFSQSFFADFFKE